MSIRFSGMLLAVVTTAFVIAPGSAWAQFNVPGFGGTGQTTGQGATAKTTTVKSSKSNTSDRTRARLIGGDFGHATAKTTTVKSSKSNTSDRMGGRGGKSGANRRGNLNSSRSN